MILAQLKMLGIFDLLLGLFTLPHFIHPNLAFPVNHLSQFMQNPTSEHLVVAKRVIRYINGFLHSDLLFRKGPLIL